MIMSIPEKSSEIVETGVVRKKIILVRPLTPTREAIELVIVQRINDNGNITTPTITVRGAMPSYIESWRFALDYGRAWIVASYFMAEWSLYVTANKR
jgi:hypothetical protein